MIGGAPQRVIVTLERLDPGHEGEADYDIQSAKGLIYDALHSGDGSLGEALRPLFIDYLRRHPDA